MKEVLFGSVKLFVILFFTLIIGCQELPTSIQNSLTEGRNSKSLAGTSAYSTQLNHFTIVKDLENDKLHYFLINYHIDLNNHDQNGLKYRWDFNGDGQWDTEWTQKKEVQFLFDDYQKYSTRMEIRDNKTVLANVEEQVAIEPACVDVDGNFYKIIKIGKQWWMAENLRVKHFRNREPVKEVKGKNEWRYLNSPAYCYYNNNEYSPAQYGLLYNWRVVIDSRGLAPNGWHVPTDADFQILENYLGGRGQAGGKLKESGTEHWYHPNYATNSSGFTALPGGYRDSRGDFAGMRGFGFFWSSTPGPGTGVWSRYMDHMYPELEKSTFFKRFGLSIRCVKNSN